MNARFFVVMSDLREHRLDVYHVYFFHFKVRSNYERKKKLKYDILYCCGREGSILRHSMNEVVLFLLLIVLH